MARFEKRSFKKDVFGGVRRLRRELLYTSFSVLFLEIAQNVFMQLLDCHARMSKDHHRANPRNQITAGLSNCVFFFFCVNSPLFSDGNINSFKCLTSRVFNRNKRTGYGRAEQACLRCNDIPTVT